MKHGARETATHISELSRGSGNKPQKGSCSCWRQRQPPANNSAEAQPHHAVGGKLECATAETETRYDKTRGYHEKRLLISNDLYSADVDEQNLDTPACGGSKKRHPRQQTAEEVSKLIVSCQMNDLNSFSLGRPWTRTRLQLRGLLLDTGALCLRRLLLDHALGPLQLSRLLFDDGLGSL
jgi:hypothetical protein